ncbi:MAG: ribonuclease H-like domain-containing protein [Eisenbergiella sp.]
MGAAVIEDKKWTLHQWFAENTAEEEAILDAFLQFSVPYKKLVHFNGTTFDIPFLQAKCKKYGLTASFAEMEQTDIYRQISPFKNLLKLSNCKQKSLEEFLGLNREDPFNGGQLIELYKVYRQERDHRLLEFCCCIMRMTQGNALCCSILSYPAFCQHPENARAERICRL